MVSVLGQNSTSRRTLFSPGRETLSLLVEGCRLPSLRLRFETVGSTGGWSAHFLVPYTFLVFLLWNTIWSHPIARSLLAARIPSYCNKRMTRGCGTLLPFAVLRENKGILHGKLLCAYPIDTNTCRFQFHLWHPRFTVIFRIFRTHLVVFVTSFSWHICGAISRNVDMSVHIAGAVPFCPSVSISAHVNSIYFLSFS